MNLILSDVEETIMIVDVPEGAADARGTVNVRLIWSSASSETTLI
jgi:hypothetical protein